MKRTRFSQKENKKEKSRTLKERTKEEIIKKEIKERKKVLEILSMLPDNWQNNETLQETLFDFVEHRKELKRILTKRACKIIANKLKKFPIDTGIEALNISIECGWTGVFPESVKTQIKTPTKSPAELFRLNFNKGYQDTFGTYYVDALVLLNDRSESNKSLLANNMILLYKWFKQNQTEQAREPRDSMTAGVFIRDYIDWLDRQKWIDDINPNTFTPNHSLTKRFINIVSNDLSFHIITGKYYA